MSLTVEKCIEGWVNSLKQLKLKADIVFFGDSLTYYGDFASVFPDKVVCNLGLRGDTIQNMLCRVEQIEILEPKQVFLMAGINDIAFCNDNVFGELFESLVRAVTERNPRAQLILQSITPVNNIDFTISCTNEQIRRCNKVIEIIALNNKLAFLDLYSKYEINGSLSIEETEDGLHLKREAYRKWYDMLTQFEKGRQM